MEPLRTLVTQYQQKSGVDISYKSFGRTDMGIIEVAPDDLRSTAVWLRSDENLRFDWLEFMSVYERKNRLYVSYFVRSKARGESCILRVSPELETPDAWVILPSLTILWPMLLPFEEESSRLFGMQFLSDENPSPSAGAPYPFPLRKGFAWKGMPT